MALENLIALFGEEATANRVQPFSEHFFNQLEFALAHFPNSTNPYLSQLLLGRFSALSYYPWLEMPCSTTTGSIEYRCQTMEQALSEVDSNSFDIVHLSNILDWVEPQTAQRIIEYTARVLTKGGEVIIRQLNSTLDIRALHSGITWNEDLSAQLHRKDRSFFYRGLHVGGTGS
jgi:S-adenosylmethionine-diacylglycerol 3-amino-3-carboxypropyl transferase